MIICYTEKDLKDEFFLVKAAKNICRQLDRGFITESEAVAVMDEAVAVYDRYKAQA